MALLLLDTAVATTVHSALDMDPTSLHKEHDATGRFCTS
jgi:hypothetical protein